jgi:hypothetical protein
VETSSTVTRPVDRLSTRQMSSRSSHTPCPPEYTCSVRVSPDPDGTASDDSGSRKACSMRWVWNTSWIVCALAASSPSTSPRAYTLCDRTLSAVPHTATSAPGSIAASGSVTGASTP